MLTKKPLVPVKKSPTVSSVGNIFSGFRKVVSSSTKQSASTTATSIESTTKSSSSDSLDGIGNSRVAVSVILIILNILPANKCNLFVYCIVQR